MLNLQAFAIPGPLELIILLAIVVIPLAVLFAVVFLAVKLAMKSKGQRDEPPQR